MNKKISYLIATTRHPNEIKECLDGILNLPRHNCEIIICSPQVSHSYYIVNNISVTHLQDIQNSGSVFAFNYAFSFSIGDYIAIIIEDMQLPSNFLNILDWMESDFMKKKKFKIVNLSWDGGPGLYTYGHDDVEDGTSLWSIDAVDIRKDLKPYSLIPLPFFARETIINKLDNHIFNPIFKHHYPDHWLGLFASKNEEFEPNKWRCPTIGKYKNIRELNRINTFYDNYDLNVFKFLSSQFEPNTTKYI